MGDAHRQAAGAAEDQEEAGNQRRRRRGRHSAESSRQAAQEAERTAEGQGVSRTGSRKMIRKLLRRVSGVEALGAWTRQQLTGVRTSVAAAEKHGKSTGKKLKELRETVALERRTASDAQAALAAQRAEIAVLSARLTQVERLADANERLAKLLFRPDSQEIAATAAHVRAAVTHSLLRFEPGPHVVIDDVLPHAAYARLLAAIPPVEFFTGRSEERRVGKECRSRWS